MRLADSFDENYRVRSFEISNVFFHRRDVCRVFESITGVKRIRKQLRQDTFCEYELNGVRFIAEEPFGDNSVYWVGPLAPGWSPELEAIRNAFLDAKPTVWGYLPWVVLLAVVAVSFFSWGANVSNCAG